MTEMIPEAEALNLISEMGQSTGINLSIGLNAYIDEPDHDPFSKEAHVFRRGRNWR